MTAHPEVLGQLRHGHGGRRGFARSRRQHERHRCGQVVQVRRSPQAVACRKRDVEERGKPQTLLDVANLGRWSTAPEAPKGKPGNGTRLEPTLHGGTWNRQAEQDGHRESPPDTDGVSSHAEDSEVGKAHDRGKDVTEGRSPHRQRLPDPVGPEDQKPTSLRGRANKAQADKRHRFRDLSRCVEAELLLDGWPALQKEAASGVDHVTADAYAANRQGNIEAWVQRVQTQRYRTTLVRRCSIPQAHGTERPRGMPALEDTLVQLACAKLLTAIYAQDVLDGRDGYRSGRGALEAVRDRPFDRQYGRYGSLVEADIQGFFDHRDPTGLLDMLRLRIDDRAFLHLIRTWLKARIVDTDGPVSPVLAQVSLHDALDRWCETVVKPHGRGEALLCR